MDANGKKKFMDLSLHEACVFTGALDGLQKAEMTLLEVAQRSAGDFNHPTEVCGEPGPVALCSRDLCDEIRRLCLRVAGVIAHGVEAPELLVEPFKDQP